MANEAEHLAKLRAIREAMETQGGGERVTTAAINLLLDISIAHHEAATETPVQAVIDHPPGFMESGNATGLPGTV